MKRMSLIEAEMSDVDEILKPTESISSIRGTSDAFAAERVVLGKTLSIVKVKVGGVALQ